MVTASAQHALNENQKRIAMALNYTNLATEMETNLDAFSQAAGKGPLPDLGKADREMFFKAIAKAVVEHIQANAEVEVNDATWPNPADGTIS
jgi:hypothetical protein